MSNIEGLEQVVIRYDLNAGWISAIRVLCDELSSPSRGDRQCSIPTDWVVSTILDNWMYTVGVECSGMEALRRAPLEQLDLFSDTP